MEFKRSSCDHMDFLVVLCFPPTSQKLVGSYGHCKFSPLCIAGERQNLMRTWPEWKSRIRSNGWLKGMVGWRACFMTLWLHFNFKLIKFWISHLASKKNYLPPAAKILGSLFSSGISNFMKPLQIDLPSVESVLFKKIIVNSDLLKHWQIITYPSNKCIKIS